MQRRRRRLGRAVPNAGSRRAAHVHHGRAAEANGPAGVLPSDLDDVGSAEYFYPGASSVWFENTTADPAEPGPFERHAMTDELGRAIELAVIPDLLGDGATAGSGPTTSTP